MADVTERDDTKASFNAVFFISLALVAGIGTWGLVSPDGMTGALLGFTDNFLQGISWYWLLLCTGFLNQIIMAAHRPSIADSLLGSSTARAVRHAKCSVQVVREGL